MRDRLRQGSIGAVLGALLMLVGIALAPDAAPGPGSTTTTTRAATATPGPFWHDPHETIIGPVAVVPASLVVDDGEAILAYRVEPITPAVEGIVFEDESGPPVGIEVFALEAGGREFEGRAARLGSTEVRFDVGPDFSADEMTGVRVERYWLRVPHGSDFDLPATRGAAFEVDADITVSVDAVVAQASGTIVNLDTTRMSNEFVSARNPIVWVTGRGAGWRSSLRSSGAGMGGVTGVQLVYEGAELPDPMPLTVSAPTWLPVDRTVSLDVEGVAR